MRRNSEVDPSTQGAREREGGMTRWVRSGILENRFEADRVAQALEEAKVPFLIKTFEDTAYDGLYVLQKGWGMVLVPDHLQEEAERVVAEVKKTFKEEGEDEIDEPG